MTTTVNGLRELKRIFEHAILVLISPTDSKLGGAACLHGLQEIRRILEAAN